MRRLWRRLPSVRASAWSVSFRYRSDFFSRPVRHPLSRMRTGFLISYWGTYWPCRSACLEFHPLHSLHSSSAWFIALFAGMRFQLLIERHIAIAGLRIAMRKMPSTTEVATIHPKLSTALTPALISRTLCRCLVVIHDLIRLNATFRYKVMHICVVYSPAQTPVCSHIDHGQR